MSLQTILVVEHEPIIALDVARAFRDVGVRVVTSNSVQLALELVDVNRRRALTPIHGSNFHAGSQLRNWSRAPDGDP
jgi:CheY-like chemotaxis protein